MKMIGESFWRIDTHEGAKEFLEQYDISPYQYIFEHENFHITRIFPENYQFIALLDWEGKPENILYLEEKDHLMVYNTIEGEIFNSDGMTFFSLIQDCKRAGTFCIENSPYSYQLKSQEDIASDLDSSIEDVLQNIIHYCEELSIECCPNKENVLIVRQL